MTFFFDRDVGVALPKALLTLHVPVCYHQQHFPMDCDDDVWLPIIGHNGWTLVGHDKQHHLMPNELYAIKQYNVGCFYLWGANATRWEKMRCFARAYDRIVKAIATTPRPFIYLVTPNGLLRLASIS